MMDMEPEEQIFRDHERELAARQQAGQEKARQSAETEPEEERRDDEQEPEAELELGGYSPSL